MGIGDVIMIILLISLCAVAIFTTVRWLSCYSKMWEAEEEVIIEKSKNRRLVFENWHLRNQLAMKQTDFSRYQSDPDVTAAVKYAMTRAHPDNGGKQEDFIKFRMIYEKLK